MQQDLLLLPPDLETDIRACCTKPLFYVRKATVSSITGAQSHICIPVKLNYAKYKGLIDALCLLGNVLQLLMNSMAQSILHNTGVVVIPCSRINVPV
jgi:hypothetical protein